VAISLVLSQKHQGTTVSCGPSLKGPDGQKPIFSAFSIRKSRNTYKASWKNEIPATQKGLFREWLKIS
jgi:hypothetical protein